MSYNTQYLEDIGVGESHALREDVKPNHAQSVVAAQRRWWEGLVLARRRRAAINELSRLYDWQLADIGIDRERIPELVDGMTRQASDRRRTR